MMVARVVLGDALVVTDYDEVMLLIGPAVLLRLARCRDCCMSC
jgi:hypothetical protein